MISKDYQTYRVESKGIVGRRQDKHTLRGFNALTYFRLLRFVSSLG